jgi:hypothetical protein
MMSGIRSPFTSTFSAEAESLSQGSWTTAVSRSLAEPFALEGSGVEDAQEATEMVIRATSEHLDDRQVSGNRVIKRFLRPARNPRDRSSTRRASRPDADQLQAAV